MRNKKCFRETMLRKIKELKRRNCKLKVLLKKINKKKFNKKRQDSKLLMRKKPWRGRLRS